MKTITELKKTSTACPEQYEGFLDTGERVYLRCRYGISEMRIGNEDEWNRWDLKTVAKIQDPENPHRGLFGPGELADLFRIAEVECPVDIDALETEPFDILKHLQEAEASGGDEKIILTMDKDILNGKDKRFENTENLIEITPKMAEFLKGLINKRFRNEK